MELATKYPELSEIMGEYQEILNGILKGLKIVDDLPVAKEAKRQAEK